MTPFHSTGFALVELLIVVALLVVLVCLVVPSVIIERQPARRAVCGNNQRQLVLAMAVYATEHERRWPVATVDAHGYLIARDDAARDPLATAIASLEFLAWTSRDDLAPRTFSCPSERAAGRHSPPPPMQLGPGSGSTWVVAGPDRIGYAYDWSVPTKAWRDRVLIADRHTTVHGEVVIAAFADGHADPVGRNRGIFANRAAAGDDIYSATGDGPMDVPDGGSTTRAFVR